MYLVAGLGWLFVQNSPSMLFAATSDALSITITPRDNVPPAAVTDLSASPGGVGQMLLQWTAPDSNNNLIAPPSAAASYQIRIATYSADSLGGDTTAWWTLATDVSGEPPPSAPGTTDYLLLNGLSPGVTYYAGLISFDAEGLSSSIDIKSATFGQQANALIFQPATPPTPLNFTGVALSSNTLQWSWNSSVGASFYTLNAYPSGSLIDQTTDTFLLEGSLGANTPASRTLRAGNGTGLSNATGAQTVYTLAAVPINLSITLPGTNIDLFLPKLGELAFSQGSACHTGSMDASPVLQSLGLTDSEAQGTLRLSLGRWTTQEDLNRATAILAKAFN
jgi:hypothetical protein